MRLLKASSRYPVDVNAAGSSVSIGVPTSGRIPGGAIVEREVRSPFYSSEHIVLNTRQTDFTTVNAITDAINSKFGAGTAKSLDGRSIAVLAPAESSSRVSFLSLIENLDVIPWRANGESSCELKDRNCGD